jgi:AraC family transcriptional regulator
MEPRIVDIEPKKLVGSKILNSLSEDKTGILWQNFMPKRHQIKNRTRSGYFSIQNYSGALDLSTFSEETEYEKWAAVEVTEYSDLPEGLETFLLPGGKYAIFIHHGLAKEFPKTWQYIYETWLPKSEFELDVRPHFEIMGDKYYGPTDANSEEEIWVPIK